MRRQTSHQKKSPENTSPADGTQSLFAGGLIVAIALAVYSNSFSGPFIFDDYAATTRNPSIRHLSEIGHVLSPPSDSTTGGRPVVNLTYALNYAVSGFHVWSYHVFNLLVHILAGLTLFGLMRRTLERPVLRERFGKEALPLALAIALLWVVHPLQTSAVTYISERAESLMGLFYLLTLYAFVRSSELPSTRIYWSVLCVTSCLLGMVTKEVMATAPLMVLLYDRTFLAGSFREAWRLRKRLYVALMATWLMLVYSFQDVPYRNVGFGREVDPWTYALTECQALVHYLRLTIWPHPLLLDYGSTMVSDVTDVLPQAFILLLLLTATIVAFVRWPVMGFAGVWFFVILAPTSSIIPLPSLPEAEYRVYLSLAAVMTLVVLGLYRFVGQNSRLIFLGLVMVFGMMTFQRNEVYQSDISIIRDDLAQRPDNPRAHDAYGYALMKAGNLDEAIPEFQKAIELNPDLAEVHGNWGLTLARLGRRDEAIEHYKQALQLKSDEPEVHYNWGMLLLQTKQLPEAVQQFQQALLLDPGDPDANNYMGIALAQMKRPAEAIPYFQKALESNPQSAETHNNWGIALLLMGQKQEAAEQFSAALRLDPNYKEAGQNLARLESPSAASQDK